jgi:hypothetical protein
LRNPTFADAFLAHNSSHVCNSEDPPTGPEIGAIAAGAGMLGEAFESPTGTVKPCFLRAATSEPTRRRTRVRRIDYGITVLDPVANMNEWIPPPWSCWASEPSVSATAIIFF